MTKEVKPMIIPSLTGIRGVAALWVMFFHIQNAAIPIGLPFFSALPILKDGFRGVDLFFLLSGFILQHVHQRDFWRLESREVLRFAALRIVRVYPLALAVLLLIVLTVLPLPGFIAWFRERSSDEANSYSALGFLQTALLANRWFIKDFGEWNGPVWSLSTEILAYVIFPLLACASLRSKSEVLSLAVGFGMLVGLIIFEAATHNIDRNFTGRLAIVRALTCFPAGVVLYRVGVSKLGTERGQNFGASLASASTALLVVVLLIPKAAGLAPLCFAGIIMGIRFGKGFVNMLLSSRAAIFLGEISFALYLVHLVPLDLLVWNVERYRITPTYTVIALSGYLVVVIVVAFVLHKSVELPAQRYGRRLVARLLEQDAFRFKRILS